MNKFLCSVVAIVLFFSCGKKSSDNTEVEVVAIDGSSTVYPITEAMAEEFRIENPKIKVTIGVSGTGGGFKKFSRGEVDIANASRPIKAGEDSLCKASKIEYVELPIAYDGLAIVTHSGNSWLKSITVKELKIMWEPAAQGKINRWNQIRKEWPNEEIHLFGAGTQSGTFDYFTEAVVGTSKSCRGDYTASEDDNVLVQGISTDKNALGFFGIDYYVANKEKLRLVPVDDEIASNGQGPISPTEETVKNGTYQPLSRPLFIYVNKKSVEKKSVKDFVNFYINNAPELVGEAGYIALTPDIYKIINKRFSDLVTGSAFIGLKTSVGIKMADVLKME